MTAKSSASGGDLLDPQLLQVVALQDGVGGLRLGRGQAGAEHADQRVAQPQHPALGRAQPGVAAGLDGERHDPVGEPLGVDPGRTGLGGLRRPFAVLAAALVLVLARAVRLLVVLVVRPAVPLRAERRRGGRGQRDQVRAAGVGERQVEDVGVVDRVEGPLGQERQVPAVGGEGGREVVEPQRGRVGDRQVGGRGELELPQRAGAGVGPGQPAGVGREGQVRWRRPPAPAATSRTSPVCACTSSTRPSCEATAIRWPSGETSIRAPGRAARRRAGAAPCRPAAGGRRDLQRVVAVGVGHPHHVLPSSALREHPRQRGCVRPARRPAPARGRRGGSPSGWCRAPRRRCRGRCGRAARRPGSGRRAPGGAGGRYAGRRAARRAGAARRRGCRAGGAGPRRRTRPACRRWRRAGRRTRPRGPRRPPAGCAGAGPSRRAGWSTGRRCPRGRRGTRSAPPPTAGTRCSRRALRAPGRTRRRRPGRATTCRWCRPGSASSTRPPGPSSPTGAVPRRRGRTPGRRPVRRAAGRAGPPSSGTARAQVRRVDASPREVTATSRPSGVQPRTAVRPSPQYVSRRDGPPSSGADVHLGRAVPGRRPRHVPAVRGDPRPADRHVVRADPPGAAAVQRRHPYVVLGGEGDDVTVRVRVSQVRRVRRARGLRHAAHLITINWAAQ